MEVSQLKRRFIFKKDNNDVELQDPNPTMSPGEVLKFYTGSYAELTTASVKGPKLDNDIATYEFIQSVGVKG